MRKKGNLIPFPISMKKNQHEDIRSNCKDCIYKTVSSKLLTFAITVINEVPLKSNPLQERRIP